MFVEISGARMNVELLGPEGGGSRMSAARQGSGRFLEPDRLVDRMSGVKDHRRNRSCNGSVT
jgi:hypothetical protein